MNQSQLLQLARKWWWLLVTAAILAGVTCSIILSGLSPTYRATATLVVGQTISNPNPTSAEIYLGQQLASEYAAIGMRDPVKGRVREALGIAELPDYSVRPLPDSQLIEVSVVDADPKRAQAVANELADQLVLESPTATNTSGVASPEFIQSQLSYLEGKIKETQQDLSDLQTEIADLVSAADIQDAQLRVTGLQEKLTTLQTNYASLLSSSRLGANNYVQVLEEAKVPTVPVGPSRPIIIALASVLGLVIGGAGVFLMEALDDSLKTPEEISRVLGSKVIGYLPNHARQSWRWFPWNRNRGDRSMQDPVDMIYDLLSTNLWFLLSGEKVKTVLITSLQPGSGKTTTALRLARHLARNGKKTILVDADLRQPGAQAAMDIEMSPGLGEVLRDGMPIVDVLRESEGGMLSVVPSGNEIGNPAHWFEQQRVKLLGEELAAMADVVLFDSPPSIVPETLVLAAALDAVILVVEPGRIQETEARQLVEPIQRTGVRLLGIILNRIPEYLGYSPRISYYRYDGLTRDEHPEDNPVVHKEPHKQEDLA